MTIDTKRADLRADPAIKRFDGVRELLPSADQPTPLVRVHGNAGPSAIDLYLKLEWLNPFGSIKDRTAAYLLAGLEANHDLDNREIVEPTSGNTGIALAALAASTGRRVTVTVPDGVPEEKKVLLRMLGAEVWETPDDLCPVDHPKDGAIALARSLAASEGGQRYVMPDQYTNADNVLAHYATTGPEIWLQTEGTIRYFVAALGTCGTITGVGRYLKERDPTITVIGVEPQPGHKIPGLKSFSESSEPSIFDRSVVDQIVRVDDGPAYDTTLRLHREEGLLVGPSTGAIVHAAREISGEGLAVGVSPDSSLKYTSYFAEVLGGDGLPKV